MGKRYTVCTVQIRKMPVPERYMHVYWGEYCEDINYACTVSAVRFVFSLIYDASSGACTLHTKGHEHAQ